MYLLVCEMMVKAKTDELTFFRIAHIWSFGTDPDLTNDVNRFIDHGIVPKYVFKYAQHVQEQAS